MNFDEQNIISLLGIQSLPDDRKLEIIQKLTDLIQKKMMVRMVESLSDQDQEKFAELLDAGEAEAIQQFVTAHFPHYQEWLNEEVNLVKQDLSAFISQQAPR